MIFRLFVLLAVFFLAGLAPAFAASEAPREFRHLPVLHEGRLKPLDSFARVEMRRIAGKTHIGAMSAPAWLAEALFDPARAARRPLFEVRDQGLRIRLGLDEKGDRLYSLQEIAGGLSVTEKLLPGLLQKQPGSLSAGQRELLELHERALAFAQLLEALGMILPLDSVPAPGDRVQAFSEGATYLELVKLDESLRDDLRGLVERKGADPENYTPEETALALAGMRMESLRVAGASNTLFRIMPPAWQGQEEWLSPWAALQSGQGSPEGAQYLKLWQDMAKAYRAGDKASWVAAARAVLDTYEDGSHKGFTLEVLYNDLRPFRVAEFLYAIAFLLLALGARFPVAACMAYAVAGAGGLSHAAGIALRVAILARPPVGTLYESMLFVSLVSLIGALLCARLKAGKTIFGGGLAVALGLLLAAPAIAPQGDSLEMLVAVLNTNFWLAAHVLTITAGYGVCLLAAAQAHVALFRGATGRASGPPDNSLHRVLLVALLLSAVGTALGGIWADQSWGRFWGWDPKENGALLIVLWCAWILHGRMSGHLTAPLYLAACAFLSVVVALSWLGVNLLGVGLHSYGFTSGLAVGLAVFCAAEISYIALALLLIYRRAGKTAEAHAS